MRAAVAAMRSRTRLAARLQKRPIPILRAAIGLRRCTIVTLLPQTVESVAPLCFVAGTADERGLREAFVARTICTILGFPSLALGVALLAGCADGGGNGDPGAIPLASGQSCGSIRQELDKLDRKGTQSKVEAATAGKKLAPAVQVDVDRYNSLLNQYLGARCHV